VNSKLLQVKLAVDMILTCMLLFSDMPMMYKVGIGFIAFDYSMLSSKRIEDEQNKENEK
jgi:hypothetical protein